MFNVPSGQAFIAPDTGSLYTIYFELFSSPPNPGTMKIYSGILGSLIGSATVPTGFQNITIDFTSQNIPITESNVFYSTSYL